MRHNSTLVLLILFAFTLFGQSSKKISYLALGDSYTIGESVKESQRWPNLLADSLVKAGYEVEKPIIIAKTGWRSDELISAIEKRPDLMQFDLVSLLIGVNNQYQGKDIAVFKKEFKALLQVAIDHSKKGAGGVFVLSIPDYGVTPFAASKKPAKISREIKLYNTVCREICEQKNILFIDITPISREARTQTNLLASDELHPSSLMYQKWTSLIMKNLNKVNLKSVK